MSKQKGNVSLRVTDTPSGRVCSIIYRGPNGKQTLKNLGFCDPFTVEGKARCIQELQAALPAKRAPRGTSG